MHRIPQVIHFFNFCDLWIFIKFLVCVVLWLSCVLSVITWGKHFGGGDGLGCLFYHVNIKWQTVSETVSSSSEGSNLSARQHPPKVSLGPVHKASLWVLPAGIHLKTAEHNFGIKVELDLKGKQRKCPKPVIILTSKEVIENVDRNPCKGRAN